MWQSVYEMIRNKDLSVVASGQLKKLKKNLENVIDCWKDETIDNQPRQEDQRVLDLIEEREYLVNMLT